jgi:hypothetical protein
VENSAQQEEDATAATGGGRCVFDITTEMRDGKPVEVIVIDG